MAQLQEESNNNQDNEALDLSEMEPKDDDDEINGDNINNPIDKPLKKKRFNSINLNSNGKMIKMQTMDQTFKISKNYHK